MAKFLNYEDRLEIESGLKEHMTFTELGEKLGRDRTRVTKPYRRKGICHPNGPCIAGYNRLFVTVEGKFYPCERVSETNEVYCIGDIKSGIETKKVLRLLNTGKLTETECKNCWALNLCSICAADFGEDNDLSTSKKLQKCSVAKKEVEEHLVEYCTLREYGFNFEN